MPYKVVIAEDNKYELDILWDILSKDTALKLVGKCSTGREAVKCCELNQPDIVFLDIAMPCMSGIEAARIIRSRDKKISIVFATGLDGHRNEAFEVYASDYIMKPYDFSRIEKTLDRIKSFSYGDESNYHDYVEINFNWNKVLLRKSDILFVECINRTSYYHTADNSYKCNIPLKEVQKQLGEGFMQTHKSYIVNLSKIKRTETISRTCLITHFANSVKNAYISARYFEDLRMRLQE